ncbi:MAG: hypothetical protein ACYTFK_13030 [Planctomycetota bacterium]|jgi:uncharacterized protein YjeT (DUF2065 family)
MDASRIEWIVFVVGALIAAEAAIILIKPGVFRKLAGFFIYDRMLYIPAAIAIVVGVVFLIFARECLQPKLIIVFGLIAAAKGLAIFLNKPETFKKLLDWFSARSDTMLRLLSILELAIGVLIMYGGMPR